MWCALVVGGVAIAALQGIAAARGEEPAERRLAAQVTAPPIGPLPGGTPERAPGATPAKPAPKPAPADGVGASGSQPESAPVGPGRASGDGVDTSGDRVDAKGDRETELVLKDRQRVSGKLVEVSPTSVVLEIQGIPTRFTMEQIGSIRELPTVEQRHKELRSAIGDQDVEGLLRLAQWLHERGRLGLALREIEHVLTIEPNNRNALGMRTLVEEQQKINRGQAERAAGAARGGTSAGQSGGAPAAKGGPKSGPAQAGEPDDRPVGPRAGDLERDDFPLLTDEQINLMRVFEVDLRSPPAISIKRSTASKFLDKYAGTVVEGRGTVPVGPEARDQFLRQSPAEILGWLFDLRAREFYEEVEVRENPRSMRLFRDNINRTWLTNACSTTKCHGGEEAGRLYLYNKRQSSDRSAYTNFFILEKFRTSQGVPLIDYQDPSRSPLLQMGLPREKALVKHPEVKGIGRRWTPAFDGPDDPRFRQAVEWILSMYPNRPDYPIDYAPPVPGPLVGRTTPDKAPPR
jgi:hypothetical protein